jgi:hypothetical protein
MGDQASLFHGPDSPIIASHSAFFGSGSTAAKTVDAAPQHPQQTYPWLPPGTMATPEKKIENGAKWQK